MEAVRRAETLMDFEATFKRYKLCLYILQSPLTTIHINQRVRNVMNTLFAMRNEHTAFKQLCGCYIDCSHHILTMNELLFTTSRDCATRSSKLSATLN